MKYLITGIGNVGSEYQNTRHNIGFDTLDALAKASNVVFEPKKYGDITELKFKGRTLVLLKPNTYVNLSGKAVNYWLQAQKIPLENLLVVTDDLALPFGTLRIKGKGSDGGHNGLANINQVLGSNRYARLRFGIGNDFQKGGQVDYVLGKWDEKESDALPGLKSKSIEGIQAFTTIGIERTMNHFNTK